MCRIPTSPSPMRKNDLITTRSRLLCWGIACGLIALATLLNSGPPSAAASSVTRKVAPPGSAATDPLFWTDDRVAQALANDLSGGAPRVTPSPTGSGGTPLLRHTVVPNTLPTHAVGKLLLRSRAGLGSCSGTLIDTPSRRLVLTAAHCLFDEAGWVSSVRFLPGYEFGRSFRRWGWRFVEVAPGWIGSVLSGGLLAGKFDIGVVSLSGPLGGFIEGVDYELRPSRFDETRILGYPAGAMRGQQLRMCSTGTWKDTSRFSRAFPGPAPVVGQCDMAPGSSGGPWLVERVDAGGAIEYVVKGVTSVGWSRGGGRGRVLSSPFFGGALARLIRSAES